MSTPSTSETLVDATDTPRPRPMSCLLRLTLFVLAAVLLGLPVYLLLPDAWVQWGLRYVYDPLVFDLDDPLLLDTWRAITGAVVGLLLALLGWIVLGIAHWRRRRAEAARVPEPLKRLRAATKTGDEPQMVAYSRAAADALGEDAVPELLHALRRCQGDEARRAVAADLYRLGRAVTAEVALRGS